jgi:hypothetical protein
VGRELGKERCGLHFSVTYWAVGLSFGTVEFPFSAMLGTLEYKTDERKET